MALLMRMVGVVMSTTALTLLLPLPLAPPTQAFPGHPWRYIFPFFPEELDILVGHLRTTVTRLQEVLHQCEEMLEGEWEEEYSPVGVMKLSAGDDDDDDDNGNGNGNGDDNNGNGNGNDDSDSMEEKVEQIAELREVISRLEDKIEECRFHFWTGSEVDD